MIHIIPHLIFIVGVDSMALILNMGNTLLYHTVSTRTIYCMMMVRRPQQTLRIVEQLPCTVCTIRHTDAFPSTSFIILHHPSQSVAMCPSRGLSNSCGPFNDVQRTMDCTKSQISRQRHRQVNRDAGDFFLGKQFLPKETGRLTYDLSHGQRARVELSRGEATESVPQLQRSEMVVSSSLPKSWKSVLCNYSQKTI